MSSSEIAPHRQQNPRDFSSLVGHAVQSRSRNRDSHPNLDAGFESTVNAIVQMMSETASDLRTPLAAVRQAMRGIADGEGGAINARQSQSLRDAMDQCDCMDQIVGEMMQLQRLRAGLPRVRRSWVAVTEIRDAVNESLRPWSLQGHVDVLWDGADNPQLLVFADPDMLRRLLVNLVASAIRTSREQEAILVRLQVAPCGGAVTWSVVDRGQGISQQEMKQIEFHPKASADGNGLGLTISRQLATLHFSTLRLRSRLGFGTEVSFQTPVSGPKSVAESWVRWRQRGAVIRQPLHDRSSSESVSSRIQRQVRLDPPMLSVELGHDNARPRIENLATVRTVSLGAAMSRSTADEFDTMLQNEAWLFDLVYRVDTRRWIWLLDSDSDEAMRRCEAIADVARLRFGSVRLDWGQPHFIDLAHRGAAVKLSDLLVRETLQASSPSTVADANQVRLGTAPIESSPVATERLDEELRRLSQRIRRQSEAFHRQAENLRPQQPPQ